ncbi:MAG TPA: tandem-95 repeat protein [Pirellulaceae bacterium]|nr:tandem-95 repeat protein [Pirellulaceae bacterium]
MNKLSRRFTGNWANMLRTKGKRQQQRRRLMAEPLEDRRMLAVDINAFHNYESPTDVNGDEAISPLDALIVINHLNGASGDAEGEDQRSSTTKPDVNGDGHISPLDALMVINDLAEGEAGAVVTFSHQATNLSGEPITNVELGETFVLQTLVQDMRSSPQGLFAAYLDLDYDESLVRVNQRESQTVQFGHSPTGGTYRLSFEGNTTAPINFTDRLVFGPIVITEATEVAKANAAALRDALLGLQNINAGDVEVVPLTGGTVSGGFQFNFEVKFGGQYSGIDVPKLVPSNVQLTNAASNPNIPTVTVFNTSDELLVPSLAQLQQDNPNTTAADRAALVARSEAIRSFTFAFPKYSSGHSGALSVAAPGSTNMIIDEIGAFTSNQTPGGDEVEVLVEVQMTALAGGVATFLGNPADRTPDHDVLVFGLDTAVSTSDIGFMPFELTISSVLTAVNDPVTVIEGSGVTPIDVLSNDTSVNGTKVITGVNTTGTSGTVTFTATGVTYQPSAGFSGQTSFRYTISNNAGATATGTVNVTVTPIVPPSIPFAANNSFTFAEDSGPQTLNVLGNDIVADGNTLAITQLTVGTQTVTPGNSTAVNSGTLQGTLALAANGTNVTFTPDADSNGSFTFTYTIVQSLDPGDEDAIRTATVGVTITPVNDPPTLNVPGARTVAEDPATPLAITGLSVNDIDGGTLTVTLGVANGSLNTAAPIARSGGSVTLTGSAANINTALAGLTYMPNLDFNGSDSLTVGVNDGSGGVANGSIAITITAVNDDPTLTVPGALQLLRDVSNSLSSAIRVADVDAGSNDVRVNLTIGTGTLAVSQTNGVQVATIANGISLTGSIANLNLALARLTYFGTTSGNFTLTVAANDLGNTGSGGGQDVTRTIPVQVLDFVPATISGEIFVDANENNQRDSGEGVGNIVVTLTGTDFRGTTVNMTTTTNADGTYSFVGVAPNRAGSPYVITQQQSSFLLNNGSTISVNVDLQGTTTTSGTLRNSVQFTNEFTEVYRLFALSGSQPSSVLFGVDGSHNISMLEGEWANGRYSNIRFVPSADGSAGTLTVFDHQLGTDRVANVSTAAGTLTFRGTGAARVYQIVGGPSLLGSSSSQGEGDATTDGAAFARGVDSIFAGGGV